jgi:hypothetical protein
MNDHSGWLINNSEICILVKNIEGNPLCIHTGGHRRRNLDDYSLSRLDMMRRAHRISVYLDATLFNERLNACAAHFGKLQREEAIQALACLVNWDNEFQMFGGFVHGLRTAFF